jgi:arginyl-tRNA synthetase
MTGDTATYMQYSYARTCGILRRGGLSRESVASQAGGISLDHPAERQLALQMCRFQESLEAAAADAKPNFLTQYLLDLSSAFSTFFDQCPVLKAEDAATKASRLKLVELTGRFIKQGLDLLGIGVREKM